MKLKSYKVWYTSYIPYIGTSEGTMIIAAKNIDHLYKKFAEICNDKNCEIQSIEPLD